jgi:hypothetical protein
MTERQLEANRRNAQRATGPRTDEGKAVSRWNALKHGVLTRAVIPPALAPYESREEFEALLDALRQELAPASAVEELLVERIAVAYWRLGRLLRAEAGAIAARRDQSGAGSSQSALLAQLVAGQAYVGGGPPSVAAQIRALESVLSNKRELRSAMVARDPHHRDLSDDDLRAVAQALLAELREQQAREDAHQQAVREAQRSLPDLDHALKLSRYEAALQRQIDRGLSDLERLQRLRGGDHVPAPLKVDVDITAGLEDSAWG